MRFVATLSAVALLAIAAPAQADTILYRVNAGGPLVVALDASGVDWSADIPITSPSPYLVDVGSDGSFSTANSIDLTDPSLPALTPEAIFQTERWDDAGGTEMQWEFGVAPGTEVEVHIFLAEIFSGITGPGERLFDVQVEGAVPAAFTNIDQRALAGDLLDRGVMISTTLTVLDGTLDIDFLHGSIENPTVKAIEIVQVPEPSTLALVALGLSGLCIAGRRRA